MTEQQQHLAQALEQQQQLIAEINALNAQLNTKRELVMKLQGVAEYLQQTGVSLPESEAAVTTTEVVTEED
jgi:hypothetical protein